MLTNIKSTYFLNLLFSYLDEREKLKLIKCNKSLQKNINISIINYKFLSEKYIIYESNGFGKEYYNISDVLAYKGEYLNGQRHGKGKEYDDAGKLIFEGEYLRGQRHGKGKEFDFNGNLSFEGEYLNGEKNGKGKKYKNGKLRFEGEYLNNIKFIGNGYDNDGNIIYKLDNKINGKGKEYNDDGDLKFEGEYLNGKRNGKGKEYYDSGELKFEGV